MFVMVLLMLLISSILFMILSSSSTLRVDLAFSFLVIVIFFSFESVELLSWAPVVAGGSGYEPKPLLE